MTHVDTLDSFSSGECETRFSFSSSGNCTRLEGVVRLLAALLLPTTCRKLNLTIVKNAHRETSEHRAARTTHTICNRSQITKVSG